MTVGNLQIGQTFSMAIRNKVGQIVWHNAHYKKVSDTHVRDEKDLAVWPLSDCGLTASTEITGTVWGK